ncbi:MAG: D-2-hydroxyacid dehydrogenase family protein [Brachymonas sp.]|nr:D-2-hydroxyacid dehydrogenase family protein [Brachymonas sp.]
MNIVILDDYQDAVRKLACASKLDALNAKVYTNTIKGVGQLSVRLRDAEILVLIRERTAITRQLLEKLPRLRLIVQTGSLGNHIDVQACTERGVAVAAGEEDPNTIAEFTWALLMSAARRIPQYMANLRHGVWQQSGFKAASMPANFGLGTVLTGKTLGIWGFGPVGQLVAGYGKAFGMRVLVWGSAASRETASQAGHTPASSRDQLFAESDFLSLHLRGSAETRGIVGLDDLSRMKTTAVFINTAHAELVHSDVLIAALNRGRPGMAALDVLEQEPVMPGNTLLRLENCLCTPHIADVELQSYEREFGAAFDTVRAFIAGQPVDLVNPEVLQLRMPL